MIKPLLTIACALVASAAFAADVTTSTTTTNSGAATSTSVSTTTSTGTISEYSPGSTFIVKESSGPVKYRYGKKVTYVTKSGKTIADDEVKTRIKVGAPVSVHYSSEGTDRIIDRVEIDD